MTELVKYETGLSILLRSKYCIISQVPCIGTSIEHIRYTQDGVLRFTGAERA